MRIVYITRHFNKSGYEIFRTLIENYIVIDSIILHNKLGAWNATLLRPFLKLGYHLECFYYRCKPLKSLNSEYLLAKKNKIPIHLTPSIKSDDTFNYLRELNPEIIVLGGGWHELIPDRIFKIPKLGCINTHPSLLPEFRGTSITRWQVYHEIKRSGVTIHYVNEKFDEGGILSQKDISVPSDITPQELFQELSVLGATLMLDLLKQFKEGSPEIIERKVDSDFDKYYKRWIWSEELLTIDWNESFERIHYHVMSNTQESYKYPGPLFEINNKKIILRKTKLHSPDQRDLEKLDSDAILVIRIEDGSIFLYRKQEKFVLELCQVQIYKNFKLKRAKAPARLISRNDGEIFLS